jgi:hypothetical protein
MKMRAVCCAALLGLILSPATADVVVSFNPAYQDVLLTDGQATVEIWADIPEDEGVIAFGMDVDILAGTSAVYNSFALAAPWDPIGDGDDGIAGVLFPPAVATGNVLLGTLTFDLVELGLTEFMGSDDYPDDLLEGFFLEGMGVASVMYGTGVINVIPEPAAFALLALGALIRRR